MLAAGPFAHPRRNTMEAVPDVTLTSIPVVKELGAVHNALLTQISTAQASAVAARILRREDATKVGVAAFSSSI